MKQLPLDAFRSAEVPDDIVLAAVERAARHSVPDEAGRSPGARWQDILDHLGQITSSRFETPRIVEPMDRLERAELIRTTPESPPDRWMLTAKGEKHLAAQKASDQIALPESPQHRRWREARDRAAAQIEEFFDDLVASMEAASDLFNAPSPHSDEWFRAAERMRNAAWQAGSAMHCLYEWPEPDEDGGPDVDVLCEPGDHTHTPDDLAERQRRRSRRRTYTYWTRCDPRR